MVRIAVIVAVLVTGFAAALAYSLPYTNTVLYLPGFLATFVLNGGAHEHRIGKVGWYALPVIINIAFYTFVVYGVLRVRRTITSRSTKP